MPIICDDPRSLRSESGLCTECGNLWNLEILDAWSDHTFIVDGCCERVCQTANSMISAANDWPEDSASLMKEIGAENLFGHTQLRRVACDDEVHGIFLDYHLDIQPIARKLAFDFVITHHEHCKDLPGWRFGAGIWNGPTLLGVIVVGNVSARGFNGRGWLEVRRLCLNRRIPQSLRWKACSTLYRWAEKEAERLGWERLITYTLEEETGMSLRYARWKFVAKRRARKGWSCPSRPRSTPTPLSAKMLWEKRLKPDENAIAARRQREAEAAERRTSRQKASAQNPWHMDKGRQASLFEIGQNDRLGPPPKAFGWGTPLPPHSKSDFLAKHR